MEPHFATAAGTALLPGRAVTLPARDVAVARSAPAQTAPAGESRAWSALFAGPPLSAAECAALESITQARSVVPGQIVFSRAATAPALVALLEGDAALGFRTADGTFRTERIERGPAWLDLSAAWVDAPHAMDAQACTLATVIELPLDALQAQLDRHPALAQRLIHGLANEVQALEVNTHELMHKDAPARLAQWLRQRCEPLAGASGQAVVHLHERKRDVASQLAITPETLSRLMRSFSGQGVIEVAGYTVRVLDVPALERLAQA